MESQQVSGGKRLLRYDEAAVCLGCSTKTIQRLVALGTLKAVRFSQSNVRVVSESMERLLAALEQAEVNRAPGEPMVTARNWTTLDSAGHIGA